MAYTLKLKHHFDASHHLLKYDGACSHPHGHRWMVKVEIKTDNLNEQDMVVDFKKIKNVIDKLDHIDLNTLFGEKFNPTAEKIAKYLHGAIKRVAKHDSKITIWESPEASITYE